MKLVITSLPVASGASSIWKCSLPSTFPFLTKNTCTTASLPSIAYAIISLSMLSSFVIFCLFDVSFTLFIKSRYAAASSNLISSDALYIFSSSILITCSYLPFRKSSAFFIFSPYSFWEI